MLTIDINGIPVRVYATDPHYPLAVRAGDTRVRPVCGAIVRSGMEGGAWPDLRDPATRGAALEVVRERWGEPTLCVLFDHGDRRWAVGRWEDGLALRGRGGDSEAEAICSALEDAPHPA